MNILGLDTSSKRLCLGIMNYKGKIVEYNVNSGIRCTELLLPTIKKALRQIKLSLNEVDYFAIGLGPGSFTGLRIGLATIKGFAQALGTPIIGLPSLDILASNDLSQGKSIICPLIDAKRNLLFTAFYEVSLNNKLKRKSPYLLINIEDLLNRLKEPHKLVTFLGNGLNFYQHRLNQKFKNSVFFNEHNWYPKGRNLIKLTLDLIDKGRFTPLDKSKRQDKRRYLTGFSDVKRIKPIYLYPKECQITNAKTSK